MHLNYKFAYKYKYIIFFELTTSRTKKIKWKLPKQLKQLDRKELAYLLFLILMGLVYVVEGDMGMSKKNLEDTQIEISHFQQRLEENLDHELNDTLIGKMEREHLLMAIDERIVAYLYQIPDYSYVGSLETYFRYRPELLLQFPSAVPLEKGNYFLSSSYGIRNHPISGKTKKHFGIDLAAVSGKPVYSSASGIVSEVHYADTGYGTHIIIKHRFGFETLYGHLDKVLVRIGQKVKQHELIATVGSSGSTTGCHLHYETIKNHIKIDPWPSLDLKKTIYKHLIQQNLQNDGEE